jgi:4-hydroxy-3-methylbut-2-enyl diphosphate reductase
MHVVSTVEDVEHLVLPDDERVAYVTQTTLSAEDVSEIIAALERRYPGIVGPQLDDICYATRNRQHAVRSMVSGVDVILVVGARNSSNSNRLCEVARLQGIPAHLIEHASDINPDWVAGAARVGLTAGASAPEYLVTEVQQVLRRLGATAVTQMRGIQETVTFRLPPIDRLELSRQEA